MNVEYPPPWGLGEITVSDLRLHLFFRQSGGVEKYFRSAVGISLSVLVKVFPHLGGDLEMVTPAPAKMGYVRVCEVLLSWEGGTVELYLTVTVSMPG